MDIDERLRKICGSNGEIELVRLELVDSTAVVLLPYSNAEVSIEVDGRTDDDIVESFKSSVNNALDQMIDHLNDCKL